ncbi:hypothetical protein BU24DRAFT_131468 [Aaosphaeria arxii CBS 175.79]|uniref:Uncharacterized protein n=1 Tax=Aaosphaeria arxii CBS 175.79 TaxID=1450172 RepID=A0A6A5Y642_9PLEO|nr:uncharacterized protein BU24DRAFT_131468 [Aaosphaeria arxii CBS 175.79]KAF2020024.1 hypothetical protein BU24DRAFT_131468 [Aaosphaeria arxii CBS 175.79]
MQPLLPIPLLLILLQHTPLQAFAQVSQQRCYSSAGELAPDYIIPCYTSWTADATFCCKRGNVCLEHNACYDGATGITYQYGCTDESYADANCPKKCGLDTKKSEWVGMVFCGGEEGGRNGSWLCHHPDNCGDSCIGHTPWDPQLERLPKIQCSEMKPSLVAISAPSTLSDIMKIPNEATALASYFAAHPTARPTSSTSSQPPVTAASTPAASSSQVSSSTAPPTSVPADPSTAESNASSARKKKTKALAIGLGVGIPLVMSLIGTALFLLYRRHNASSSTSSPTTIPSSSKEEKLDASDAAAMPGYVHKAELPGEGKPLAQHSPARTELAGSFVEGSSTWGSPSTRPVSVMPPSERGSYGAFRPEGRVVESVGGGVVHELP